MDNRHLLLERNRSAMAASKRREGPTSFECIETTGMTVGCSLPADVSGKCIHQLPPLVFPFRLLRQSSISIHDNSSSELVHDTHILPPLNLPQVQTNISPTTNCFITTTA